MELRFDGFQGSIETLYELVRRSIIEIKRVSLLYIVEKIIEYLRNPEADINKAAHYLYLLSLMALIKLSLLLPSEQSLPQEESDPMPYEPPPWLSKWREKLENLQEARWKILHHRKEGIPAREEVVGDIEDFLEAYFSILRREAARKTLESTVGRKDFSALMDKIRNSIEERGKLSLRDLIKLCEDGEEAVFSFFYLLELLRQGQVIAIQEIPFSEINIWSKEAFENEVAKA